MTHKGWRVIKPQHNQKLSAHQSVICTLVSPSVFRFQTIMSKYQWVFAKLGICIDIMEIWFRIIIGQISSIFDNNLPTTSVFSFAYNNLSKYQWICTKLDLCINKLYRPGLELLICKFHQFLTVICLQHLCGGELIISHFYLLVWFLTQSPHGHCCRIQRTC